jgi:CRP/FNR family transcriptional regulator
MKPISEHDADYICDIQAPCFQALAPEEVELIKTSKTQVKFRKGDNLTKQGTFASYVLFVAKGLAIQYVEGDNNKSFNLRIVQPGEFVGLSSVFSDNTFNYSSIAISDCHVLLVEKTAILQVISQNGIFGLSLIKRYTEQSMNLFDTLRTVLYKQMTGRIAETLLYIDEFKAQYPEIFTLLSRKQIADFAGITTESAVKMLKTLDKEEVIKLEGKDIDLLNKSYLSVLSEKG